MIKIVAVKPDNYHKIDNTVSRSAFINENNVAWLKKQNVTDVISFRTMRSKDAIESEKRALSKFGINYHQIISNTGNPDEKNVFRFLRLAKQIKERKGKIHIHCVQGANRTGMYAFIYKCMQNIESVKANVQEWIETGLDTKKYPNLIKWASNFVAKYGVKNIKR